MKSKNREDIDKDFELDEKDENKYLRTTVPLLCVAFVAFFAYIAIKVVKDIDISSEPVEIVVDNDRVVIPDKKDDEFREETNYIKDSTDDGENNYLWRLIYKTNDSINIDYSKIVSSSFKTYTKYYCIDDICSNTKDNNGKNYFYANINNNKINIESNIENIGNMVIDDINNPKSIMLEFSVQGLYELYVLTDKNELYFISFDISSDKDKPEIYEKKLIANNVKDFTILDFSYLHGSEGQCINPIMHTTDGKLYEIDEISNIIINLNNINYVSYYSNMVNIHISNFDNYDYQKYNDEVIVIKNMFISDGKIYLLTTDNDLLYSSLDNIKYEKKDKKVKTIRLNKEVVTITYEDDTKEEYKSNINYIDFYLETYLESLKKI